VLWKVCNGNIKSFIYMEFTNFTWRRIKNYAMIDNIEVQCENKIFTCRNEDYYDSQSRVKRHSGIDGYL
jgi:glucose-6-phosphate 1-dehydrogenase